MNVKSRQENENSTIELIVEVPSAEFEAAVNKIYRKQVGRINVPGFRKGKAPRKIIESMYGSGVFHEDAVNEAYPEAYEAAVAAEGIAPVARPDIEILEVGKDGFSFRALVTVKPPVTLGAYKGLTAPREVAAVTDEEVEAELKPLIERATRLESVERAAKAGDTAIIDFEGFDDGVPFAGGKGEGHDLALGSGSFIPGFEEGLYGMLPGEERELNLSFPADYGSADLAGKEVVFKVKLHELKEAIAPTLDDEFAKDVSEFETLDALKADLAERILNKRTEDANHAFEHALIDQVIENMQTDLPYAMVEYRAEKLGEDYARRITNQGIPFESYLSMTGTTPEMFRAQIEDAAQHQLLHELALEAVAAAEGFAPGQEELDAEYARLAEEHKMPVERIRAVVPAEDMVLDLSMKRAAAFLVEHAVVGDAPKVKKPAAKKKKAEETPAEETPAAKKPAAKKPAAKKKAAEEKPAEDAAAEEKPAKKAAAKKPAAKKKPSADGATE